MIRTVNLTGEEVLVNGLGGYHCCIKNTGTGTVYASAAAGISPGADGVLPIAAGESAVYPDCNGTLYLLGDGGVVLAGIVTLENFFKPAPTAGGGGGGGSYTLPAATKTTLGGVIVGDGLQVNAAGVLSTAPAYMHTQGTAEYAWTITHGLKCAYPTALFFDEDGEQIFGDISYVSQNLLTVTFCEEMAGTAIISR